MKLYKSMLFGGALALGGMLLAGCQNSFDEPERVVPEATMQANTTIAELKAMYWQSATNYADMVGVREDESHYIIKGRVISSDAAGNVYKAMYIQDGTDAITLSINQNSLYNDYRVGQEIVLDVTGLYVGKYAGLQQIGGLGSYNGTPQVSFASYETFVKHCELNGLPEREFTYINYGDERPTDGKPYCTVMTISQLPTAEADVRNMQSQYVELRNVYFADGGKLTYADYQTNTSRDLKDDAGNTIVVRSSGYATFYNETLPEGTGTVRGLLSYYNGSWQLIINSTADCIFDHKGQFDDPYTVDEALELQGTGAIGWVNGYIVGSVKAGVSEVTSNDNIIWSADADLDNNIVIGGTPDEKDYTKCLVMELKVGSALRSAANLIDNPGVYGKNISVRGAFESLYGMPGIAGNNGTNAEFSLEGYKPVTPDNPTDPSGGSGTADSPYSITQVKATTSDVTGVWVKGYIVGWIDGMSYSSGCQFNGTTEVLTNILLAASPDETNPANCIPVQIPSGSLRSTLSLGGKPDNYKKEVVILGDITKYFGERGVKNVSEFKYADGATTNPDNPDTPDNPVVGGGTEDEPFTVANVLASTTDSTGVWVEGYIVGWIDGMTYATGCQFNGTTEVLTNILLAASASETDPMKCIPVQIPAGDLRSTLSLGGAPGNYKKHVKINGDVTKYFGVRGLKNASQFKVID